MFYTPLSLVNPTLFMYRPQFDARFSRLLHGPLQEIYNYFMTDCGNTYTQTVFFELTYNVRSCISLTCTGWPLDSQHMTI